MTVSQPGVEQRASGHFGSSRPPPGVGGGDSASSLARSIASIAAADGQCEDDATDEESLITALATRFHFLCLFSSTAPPLPPSTLPLACNRDTKGNADGGGGGPDFDVVVVGGIEPVGSGAGACFLVAGWVSDLKGAGGGGGGGGRVVASLARTAAAVVKIAFGATTAVMHGCAGSAGLLTPPHCGGEPGAVFAVATTISAARALLMVSHVGVEGAACAALADADADADAISFARCFLNAMNARSSSSVRSVIEDIAQAYKIAVADVSDRSW